MKFTFITRTWKGQYEFDPNKFKSMRVYSDESIEAGDDCVVMCLLEGETSLTPKELYSIWKKTIENGLYSYRREVKGLMVTSWFKDVDGIIHGNSKNPFDAFFKE